MYHTKWDQLPETEVLPNNFRRAVAGLEVGINLIRWVHPTGTSPHVHEDAEKAIMVLDGEMEWEVGDVTIHLSAGDVAIVPRGVRHFGRTTGRSAQFFEAFAPARIQNLVGFLGLSLLTADDERTT